MGDTQQREYWEGFHESTMKQAQEVVRRFRTNEEWRKKRVEEVTTEEVKTAIKTFKNKLASDLDGVSHDMFKVMNDENVELITEVINEIFQSKHG